MELGLSPDQVEMQHIARDFTSREIVPRIRRIDDSNDFDRELYLKLGEIGFLGMTAPAEWGGGAIDNVTWCLVVEEVSRGAAIMGNAVQQARSIQDLVLKVGDATQVARYLPALIRGESIFAFALTEPAAGSDAASLATTARLERDHYVLNGQKQFITLAGVADHMAVAASLDRSQRSKSIRVFLVPRDARGLQIGSKLDLLGLRGMATCPLFLDECLVPASHVLGSNGAGFRAFMHALDGGRLGVAASAVGQAQAAFDAAWEYAGTRVQFGKPIVEHPAIEQMLVDMQIGIEAARLLTLKAAWRRDAGLAYTKEASAAKLYASQVCMRVTLDAMQVFGGYAYSKEYPIERYYRDAKIHEIWDGTSQIQRKIIGRAMRQEQTGP